MLILIMIRMQEFLTEFLPLCEGGNCKNFVGSAAVAEVCALRVLQVECLLRAIADCYVIRMCIYASYITSTVSASFAIYIC